MSDSQIGFLYKCAWSLQSVQTHNEYATILRSYYLMRCREVTNGYGLPKNHFATKTRCAHCCIEWKKGTQVKVKALKLSKKQKQKIKKIKPTKNLYDPVILSKKKLLHSNEMVQICQFCKKSTTTAILKPDTPQIAINKDTPKIVRVEDSSKQTKSSVKTKDAAKSSMKIPSENKEDVSKKKQKVEVDFYSKSHEVFSLNNKNNMLPNTVKETKVIKNNKKKKDKFAGLCQKAVLASAKMKEEKFKQNKLNLFLKPSSE